jgi:anti-anti-sigma factor
MKPNDILFSGDRLVIRHSTEKQEHLLRWTGECDFRNPTDALGPMLKTLVADLKCRRLVMDFRDLSYMNSAAVTPILVFIKSVVTKGCPVHLIYNSEISWQRTTASAMRALMPALKILTVALRNAGAEPP